MKKYLGIIILLFTINVISQDLCDSTLFYRLFDYSQKHTINNEDLLTCNIIVDSLSYRYCDHVLIQPDKISTSLTFLYGQICIRANSDLATISFFNYYIKNIGSAEEQLSFSLERLFVQRPEIILKKLSKTDTTIQNAVLNSLAWGFLNNRQFGITDPLENEPMKAMTYYENLPEPILNAKNYKEIFYQVNPETTRLYQTYSNQYNLILKCIYDELNFVEKN